MDGFRNHRPLVRFLILFKVSKNILQLVFPAISNTYLRVRIGLFIEKNNN